MNGAATPARPPARSWARDQSVGSVDLYWIPLGAGGHFVRFNGKVYEAFSARRGRRPEQDLYHSALEIGLPEGRSAIEMAWPVPKAPGNERGVVREGPVGWKWASRFRVLRYEVRCWLNGSIPDIDYAMGSPIRVSNDVHTARHILGLAPLVPPLVWG